MNLTLDTSFLILHYFSKDPETLRRSKAVLHHCRLAGNRGILPTMALAETYAIARRDAGREVAEMRFRELLDSGLEIVPLSPETAKESGILRVKYQEKIPWGDCVIAATHIMEKGDLVLSEDPHFREIRELKARKLDQFSF